MPKPPDPNLVRALAALYYGEDRATPTQDEANLVADTVFSRTQLQGYPDNPVDVIRQPGQYSPFNPTDPNYPVVSTFDENNPAWAQFSELARNAIAAPRRGITHYYTGTPPAWAGTLKGRFKWGEHTYGREERRKKRR